MLHLASNSVRPPEHWGLGLAHAGVCCCEGGKREALPAVDAAFSGVSDGKSKSGFADGDVGQLFSVTDMLCTTFSR